VNASTIVTTKYFRGAVGHDNREWSLKQVIDRVVLTYTASGKENGYFATDADAEIFEHELTYMLLHQVFSFNSPVWFNVGTNAPQQVSACFILSVDDTMDSILNWYREEGMIFKGGSGAGLNLSRIRSAKELLKSGGTASGPVSFMRGADASAGTIESGGATRRAAKMVVLDVDHPDIEEFIETKVREEDKIRALRDAGFDMDLGGKDIISVQYQNANNSVRVSDAFMRAYENGEQFGLVARSTGDVIESVDAEQLFRKMAEAHGHVLIQEFNMTTPSMHGTQTQRPVASMHRTHALSTCHLITHHVTWHPLTSMKPSTLMVHSIARSSSRQQR
jgi:ribonucleoside-diphosphate reductase alpha chain